MGRSLRKLAKYGVNVEEALNRFMNDEKLFLDCIDILLDDNKFIELGNAIKNDEYEKCYSLAVSLKGVIDNLSIIPLDDKISEIVGALSIYDYSDLNKHYIALMKAFDDLKKIK